MNPDNITNAPVINNLEMNGASFYTYGSVTINNISKLNSSLSVAVNTGQTHAATLTLAQDATINVTDNIKVSGGNTVFSDGDNGFNVTEDATMRVVRFYYDTSRTKLVANNARVIRSNGDVYTLADNGIATKKGSTDYSTYSLNVGFKNLSVVLDAAGTHTAELTELAVNAGELTLDAEADDLTVTLAAAAGLRVQGDATVKEIVTTKTELVPDSNCSLTLTGGQTSFSSLTLGNGSAFTLGTEEKHDNTLALTEMRVSGDSTINADLVLDNGATLTFTNSALITMGCSVTIGQEGSVTIVLDADEVRLLQSGNVLDLFTDVESVTLDASHITFTSADRSTIYDDFTQEEVTDTTSGKHTVRATLKTPEPATATLSLLALAALVARRKRH